ncbi:putative Peptidase S8/S53 domain-containing protein [Seiridium unicorne]|uniref:Peptidase S8/S53 domain-containing protein n=1 Tax=Seiridium unicorne TaxID=138068 RepID=A0ABR2V8R1_9PEZI
MKTAPTADIYVARVTKDRASLKDSATSVAEAIRRAAEECGADIISMSFGFPDEVPVISKTITEVQLHHQILFFAAASNSGENREEMFSANHDSVISIRETNSKGAFSDTNPPVDPYGPAVFGTLGKNVRSAWLRNPDGDLPKSVSSVATAIAVGITAMVLDFAGIGSNNPGIPAPSEITKLWTRRGMLAMFVRMLQDMENRCFFISPAKLFAFKDVASF